MLFKWKECVQQKKGLTGLFWTWFRFVSILSPGQETQSDL